MNTYVQKQMAMVANLTPETVADIDGIWFEAKAMSIPGVIEAEEDFSSVLMLDGETEIDLDRDVNISPDIEKRMIVTDRYIIAGGLSRDSDVGDPGKEIDGEGRVFCRGRRGGREDEAEIQKALGLDQYGNRDLDHEVVSDEMIAFAIDKIRDNRSVMTTLSNLIKGKTSYKYPGTGGSWSRVREVLTAAMNQEGWSCVKDYIADWFLDVRYWVDVSETWQDKLDPLVMWLDESDADSAFERAVQKGTIGNPLAVMLDVYEHSGIAFSVSGQGMQCNFDTSRGGAVWVPDACAVDNITSQVNAALLASGRVVTEAEKMNLLHDEAYRYAKSCVETYSEWRNGETYYFSYSVIDRETGECLDEHDDNCGGFYGSDSAESELEAGMLAKAIELTRVTH